MNKVDYTSFSSDGQPQNTNVFDKRWWTRDGDELAQAVAGIVKFISQYDSQRYTQYQMSARLYGNTDLMGMNGLSYSKIASVKTALKDRISYNVVQSAIDTVTSKMAKNKPKPLFLTSGGDYKMQRKAKKLDKFVEGVFYDNNAYHLGVDIFRDSSVWGDGIVHVFDHYGRIKYERVQSSELFVDWLEAFYGSPRQMHRVKNIDRQVLCDMFPEHKAAIMGANSASADLMGSYQNVADNVCTIESWHLPSGPEAKDGLHTICIENKPLLKEEWNKPFFPFAKLSWSKRLHGYWGQGLAEQIQNIQLEINKILWVIQRSFHLAGSFKVFVQNGSKVVKEHLNNDIGAIVSYNGVKPEYVVPPIVPMEIYNHLQTLKNSAYEQAGISQLSAASLKPQGLNSGKALREYNDIESDRFMTTGQAYENFYLDLAKLTVSCAKDIYSRDKKLSVTVPGKKFIETINWKEVDMEDDEFVLKIFPVSSLPSDPAGRLQTIQEYVQAGFITPRTARRLLDFPDLEQIEDLQNAEEDYLHEILEKIIEDGEYTPPDTEDDYALAKELVSEYIAQGKLGKLEEDKMEMLRTFNSQVNFLMQKAMPPAPPMVPGGGIPPANPVPTPTSDMIPNVNQGLAA